MFDALRAAPPVRFGFGRRAAIVNVDLQSVFTAVGEYRTAYETHPGRIDYLNELNALARTKSLPVVWTKLVFMPSHGGSVLLSTRFPLERLTPASRRADIDPRLTVDPERDVIVQKGAASAFHGTDLRSRFLQLGVDTLVVTGNSTSGCVRATVVDAVSHGFRTVVPEECVADVHEGPHFANLYDMAVKYADVAPVSEVLKYLKEYRSDDEHAGG